VGAAHIEFFVFRPNINLAILLLMNSKMKPLNINCIKNLVNFYLKPSSFASLVNASPLRVTFDLFPWTGSTSITESPMNTLSVCGQKQLYLLIYAQYKMNARTNAVDLVVLRPNTANGEFSVQTPVSKVNLSSGINGKVALSKVNILPPAIKQGSEK
jgi:hypothetical protein